MKPEIAYTDLKTSADDIIITDARQLALEKWMEAVTNLLNNPRPSHSDMRFIDDCLEEYKRVSKP